MHLFKTNKGQSTILHTRIKNNMPCFALTSVVCGVLAGILLSYVLAVLVANRRRPYRLRQLNTFRDWINFPRGMTPMVSTQMTMESGGKKKEKEMTTKGKDETDKADDE